MASPLPLTGSSEFLKARETAQFFKLCNPISFPQAESACHLGKQTLHDAVTI
jgi:hypothetical protein